MKVYTHARLVHVNVKQRTHVNGIQQFHENMSKYVPSGVVASAVKMIASENASFDRKALNW